MADINKIDHFEENDEGYTVFSSTVMNLIIDALNRNSNTNSNKDPFIRVHKTDNEIRISFNKSALDEEIKKQVAPLISTPNNNDNQQSCLCRYA
jgi:hypothetical protein